MRLLAPLTGRIAKALVVDLDNTLWGGVIGEEGFNGIQLGPEYPGAAYVMLQRAILDLHRRGVILAVCSKNNAAEAMEAIQNHPHMLLRPEHFAAFRINWQDKASNLREIAAELNIGVDSLAFLDDNPSEREWIRTQLPAVSVIDLPDDVLGYAAALRECPIFERVTLLEEDRERGRHYTEQRLRGELQQSANSLEEFYTALRMVVRIGPATDVDCARVAQLTQKTNQFNLTTRRYSEPQIRAMMEDPAWRLYALRASDRFGDSGLVGVALVRRNAVDWEIDTLLVSCRVIGRTIETALLAFLCDAARRDGAARVCGWYFPTKKNAPAKDFYSSHGFTGAAEADAGSFWELDLLGGKRVATPAWIQVDAAEMRTNA